MSDVDPSIALYIEETRELLGELEQGLLELETNPNDTARVDACFRAMHTIKGGGAMFGFEEISRFTHDVETVLDRVRTGDLPVNRELLSLTLAAKDHILTLLEASRDHQDAHREASDRLLASFATYLPGGAATAPDHADHGGESPILRPDSEEHEYACQTQPGPPSIYWIRLRPNPDMLLTGNDPVRLLAELDTMGDMHVLRHGPKPVLDNDDFDPERVYGLFDMLIATPCAVDCLRDVFIFVEGDSEVGIHRLHTGILRAADLDELLAELKGHHDEDLEVAGNRLEAALAAKLAVIEAAKQKSLTQKGVEQRAAPQAKAPAAAATLRVDAARLDSLVSMVGELVILQSRLRQAAKARDVDAVAEVDEDLERLTDNLRDVALGLRMLPIGSVFSQFTRLTRDLAASLGKDVEFVAHGGETELDKTVIDRIKDPLVHLLRNSLDHGLERPEERQAAGKPPQGRVTLSANHSGGNVVLVIADDGRGIDVAAVRRKAVERGLIAPEAEPTDKELFDYIFAPGFSTAAKVSDVSGRGVGMDVVKKNIEALRGTVELSSVLGQGATVTIRLPLTLAIIDGFNVMVGGDSFIVPLANLRGFQERFVEGQVRTVDTIERMGSMAPVVSLRRLFDVPGDQPGYERVVITEAEGETVGFCVDKVIGRQQAVIKSLDDCYRHLKWISGTTINGDGSISLILDVPQLVRFVRGREDSRLHAGEPFRTLSQ